MIRTPAARVTSTFVYPEAGTPVRVRFSAPVRVVSVRVPDAGPRFLHLDQPRRVVSIDVAAVGETAAGTALVAGAPQRWERLPSPVRVSWFSGGPAPKVLVRPAPMTRLAPSAPIVLTFSRPVAEVLGAARPVVIPRTSGAWHEPNANTLVFQPSGLGFPLARRVHLRLPRAFQVISGADPDDVRTLSWQVPRGSILRIEQLLAELGYLPLRWQPTGATVEAHDGRAGRRRRRAADRPVRLALREDAGGIEGDLVVGRTPTCARPRRDHGLRIEPRPDG